jgi:hypothetical protein
MISEWMKVMLEEISRKKAEAEQGRIEEQTRVEERVRVEQQGRRDDDSTQG